MHKGYLFLLCELVLMLGSIAAATGKIDGPVYPIFEAFSDIHVSISSERAEQLARTTRDLQPHRLSFWPFKTTLAQCLNSNTKDVVITLGYRSVFIIGDDEVSLHWLKKYRHRLEKIGAVGLVIQAQNLSSFRHLQQVAGHLNLTLANSDGLEKILGVHCYPNFVVLNRLST